MDVAIRDLLAEKKHYSARNIARTLGLSRKKANWYLTNGDFSLVDPVVVGSGKAKVSVWKNN